VRQHREAFLLSGSAGLSAVSEWTVTELPRLNSRVLAGAMEVDELIRRMNVVLTLLPSAEEVTRTEAMRLIVELGMWGSSVARHYQNLDQGLAKTDPSVG